MNDPTPETPPERAVVAPGSEHHVWEGRRYPETPTGLQNVLPDRFSPRHWREVWRNGRAVG